jgi:hypothetical protein
VDTPGQIPLERQYQVKTHRLALAGLGLVAALTFGAGGCAGATNDADAGTDAGATVVDPKETLATAAKKLTEESFKLNIDLGSAGTGVGAMDAPNKIGAITLTVEAEGTSLKLDTMVFGPDVYIKMDLGGMELPGMSADKWMHMDASKLPANNSLGLNAGEFDPSGAAKFLNAVATAESVDGKTITGTLDLTKAVGAAGIDDKDIAGMGEKAKAVPFEATVDDEGRLTKLAIDMPAYGGDQAQKITVTYSDFGSPVQATKPGADEITEAPETIYGTLGA